MASFKTINDKFYFDLSLKHYLIISAVLLIVAGLLYAVLFIPNPVASVNTETAGDEKFKLDTTVVNQGSAGKVSLVIFTLDDEGYILNRTERRYELMSNQRKDDQIILNVSNNFESYRYCTYPSKDIYRTLAPFICDAYQ